MVSDIGVDLGGIQIVVVAKANCVCKYADARAICVIEAIPRDFQILHFVSIGPTGY